MAFKTNMNHWEILVQFMEDHKDFARGKFVGPTGKENHKKLWTMLTTKLNSLGMGERSIEKWQRTWCDLKYSIKKKAAQLKTDQQATGGGPPSTKPLTEYESRILSILGSTFAQGVGTEEYGVGCTRAAELKDVERPLLIEINKEKNSQVKEIAEPSVGATTSILNISANIIDHDHLYEPLTSKKRKTLQEKEEEVLNKSINEMRQISNNLSGINSSLQDINNTLVVNFHILSEIKGVLDRCINNPLE